jgi:hypothetical protein
VTGADFCERCEAVTPHSLTAEPHGENGASIGWTCQDCGTNGQGALERVLVQLAVLGCDPKPVKDAS